MIYFIQCNGDEGPIKIGYTRNSASTRLGSMQSSNPYELELLACIPGGRAKEAAIQERFKHLLIRGEWFTCSPEIIDFIRPKKRREYERKEIITDEYSPHGLKELSKLTEIPYITLYTAATTGRLEARQSGSIWLSSQAAIAQAIRDGKLRDRRERDA